MKKNLMSFFCCVLSVIFLYTFKVCAASDIQRFGGEDRYETSIKISQGNWQDSDYIILVSGKNFPDALSATPLSKKYNAPILLTGSEEIGTNVMEEIKRLSPKYAFIIGGTGAISENVERQLTQKDIVCTRIAGEDRYETSAKVAQKIGTSNGAFITSGENFPDAVSVAAIAAAKEMPILLTKRDKLPDEVKKVMEANSKYYVIGGEGSVSPNAVNEIGDYKRIGGSDRYETNAAVINEFKNDLDFSNTYLANGYGFADALSGSAAAAKTKAPIALVSDSFNIKNSIIKYNIDNISTICVLGGTGVISDILVHRIINGGVIKVCIDPGHGGYDSGAVGPNGVLEKNVNLAIALKTGKILKANGIEIVYTRTNDNVPWPANVLQDLQMRCDIANNANVDYFVCIHANSAGTSANGSETYYSSGSVKGQKLAESIQKEIINATGLFNRGVKTENFYVLNHTDAPAVLVETAFISNPNEEKLLNSDSFQNTMAQAIARGVINFVSTQ
ncbi:cell wall-binding repeat-containing protein [Clostridium lundense]|uniref:cell wall-binding repeat-containing protein n=1 Tax=Clostridium lundense TaxID=319475 RepID=UPI0005554DC8|nr:cell wall-binding repeat-containing protein [Clostridium lundense]